MLSREHIEQLSAMAIYKRVLFGSLVLCVPYSLVTGLLALFGWPAVSWDGHAVTGFRGLLVAPCLGAFAAAILTASVGTACVAARHVFQRLAGPEDAEPETVANQPEAQARDD